MKTQLLPFAFLFCFISVNAQQFAPPLEISSTNCYYPSAKDIDGDGDLDIVYNSANLGVLLWRENIDGTGTFGPDKIIADNFLNRIVSFVADFDGDGDLDIVGGDEGTGRIIWYENTDGLGNFGPERLIESDIQDVWTVSAADVDNDGDMDILAMSYFDLVVRLYKNLDGQGNFGPAQVITPPIIGSYIIFTTDFDGDGNLDICVGGKNSVWFKNLDGQGNYGPPRNFGVSANLSGSDLQPADIDGDGDIDLFQATSVYGKMSWLENLDGLGHFSGEKLIAISPYLHVDRVGEMVDIDQDGDLDLLFVDKTRGHISWVENIDGQGNFGPVQLISDISHTGERPIGRDFDNDGDIDILSATYYDATYIENREILDTPHFQASSISIYPNPVESTLNIDLQDGSAIKSVMLFDILGKRIIDKKGNIQQLDMSRLSSGLYMLKVETDKGIFTQKIMKD